MNDAGEINDVLWFNSVLCWVSVATDAQTDLRCLLLLMLIWVDVMHLVETFCFYLLECHTMIRNKKKKKKKNNYM